MAKTNPKKKTSNLTKYNRAGYFFVAPFVIVFLIFSVYPVFRTLVLSFTDSKLAGMPYHFVGLKNYTRVFTDKFFWRALWNTIRIWGVNIVLQLGLAFLLTVVFSDIKYKFKGLPVFWGGGGALRIAGSVILRNCPGFSISALFLFRASLMVFCSLS